MARFVEWSDIDFNFTKQRNGEIDIVRSEDAINQSIKLLLSTMAGERVRSDLGSSLYGILFEPMDNDTAEEIQSIIETNILRYETRIILRNVRVKPNFDNHFYEIRIDYNILPSRARKNLTTFVPALGEF